MLFLWLRDGDHYLTAFLVMNLRYVTFFAMLRGFT